MGKLHKKDEEMAVEIFKENLGLVFGARLEQLLLFGSKARGDDHKDSDIDLLVVLANKEWQDEQKVFSLVTKTFMKTGVIVSPKVFSPQEMENKRRRNNVFIQAVDQDAVLL